MASGALMRGQIDRRKGGAGFLALRIRGAEQHRRTLREAAIARDQRQTLERRARAPGVVEGMEALERLQQVGFGSVVVAFGVRQVAKIAQRVGDASGTANPAEQGQRLLQCLARGPDTPADRAASCPAG